MTDAVSAVRAFNRFYTRFSGVLQSHYMGSDLSLAEARILYEVATRAAPLAAELQAELDLDAGYVSRILRRFQALGWIERGRGEDARRRPISLTTEGRANFEALDVRVRAAVADRVERLRPADRETLTKALATAQALLGGGKAPWHIRTFRAGDLPLIASRQAVLYDDYGWGRPMEVLLGEVTTAFLKEFRPGREQCWVAERAGMMAGAVLIVDAGDNVGQLRLLHVEGWARGLGIGSALVAECVAFARGAGYRTVRLWTHSVLLSARRIYEAHGFHIVSTEMHDTFGKPEQGEIWELAIES